MEVAGLGRDKQTERLIIRYRNITGIYTKKCYVNFLIVIEDFVGQVKG
jgi:hypothetical protein